ncbi:MAG TPA: hypothetical protein VIM35_05950 [Gallionella sp.]
MQARWLARMAYSHIKASAARQINQVSLPLVNCKRKSEADPFSFNKKSYWVSQNIAPPVRTVLLFRTYSETFNATLEHFQTLGLAFGTERHRCWRDEGLDVLWLAAE